MNEIVTTEQERAESGWSAGRALAALLAGALQLVVGYFTVAAIGLISVPLWGSAVLGVAWVATVALIAREVRRHPWRAVALPIVNAALLWAFIAAGGALLDWTA